MKTVVALNRITTADPGAELAHTGHFDADGNAILKKKLRTILTGELFEPRSEEELARLLEMGAVRLPTENEELILEREERKA